MIFAALSSCSSFKDCATFEKALLAELYFMAKKTKPSTFHIVGIGGSAGAIEAVMDLVGYLPSHTGMAFIYLQHQLPAVESRLASVLAKKAKIPVLEAEDQMAVEPDFFYIVPPGKEMVLSDG